MKKICELCSRGARMYCESDQASLCWDCDERVHNANFLVAKHSRILLCHLCQSLTPWKASGPKFGPTLSVCECCFRSNRSGEGGGGGRRDLESIESDGVVGSGGEDESDDDDDEDDDSLPEEEEEGENQVVPWSTEQSSSSAPAPAATTSSSKLGSFSTRDVAVSPSLKRFTDSPFRYSDDEEDGCCSSQIKTRAALIEDNGGDGLSRWRISGAEEPSQQREEGRERVDSESKRIRRMDGVSSFMRF